MTGGVHTNNEKPVDRNEVHKVNEAEYLSDNDMTNRW